MPDATTATTFTPLSSLLGGGLIGISAVALLLLNGRMAGITGMLRRLLPPHEGADPLGSAAFLVGLVAAPLAWLLFNPSLPEQTLSTSASLNIVAGFLVGFGAILGNGCTSGHGICGLARLSPRSLLAVPLFMAAGMIAVYLLRHVVGGWPWG